LLSRWLPVGYGYEGIELSARFSGPLNKLTHEGHLTASNVTSPWLRPLHIQADWNGVKANLDKAEIVADSGSASLALRGALAMASDHLQVDLSALTVRTNEQEVLALSRPCHLEARGARGAVKWEARVSPLVWEGKAGHAQVEAAILWPCEGSFDVHLREISSTLASGFLQTNLLGARIERLDAAGGWTNTPLQFDLGLLASAIGPGLKSSPIPFEVELQAEASEQGLVISNLVVTSQASSVVVAHGSLPLSIVPGEKTNLVRLEPDRPLVLQAVTRPDALFWNEIGEISGTLLREPQFELDVSGTWNAPVGKVSLRAEEIKLRESAQGKANPLPELKNLEFDLELNRDKASLTLGRALIQRQRISVSGEVPLGEGFWSRLKQKQFPDWERARGRLQVAGAEISAFQPLVPAILAPQGELGLDLELLPGLKLEGTLDVVNALTRPLGNMGPVRNIGLHAIVRDGRLDLHGGTARIGGATVSLSGQADLRGMNWLRGELPPFTLALQGTSVPLAREPEAVVRSDLRLALTKTNGAPPLISGTAHLRDSFYLSDLQDLIPGGVSAPSRRPPYFSVEDPFLADWRLAIDVDGQRFLKVRSSLFNGEVSANLKIQGTLKDPIALGDIKTDSGLVRFPFANLQVQHGLVGLTSQDPYHPQLSVLAASKQFGYDIRMEVTGPVDSPVIQFSSTPPLSSEQILLMVTAGELPYGTFSFTTQQRAQAVGVFLGRDMLSKLGIGDQTEQKLTVISGQEISEQGRPTYQVEYKLTDRWSLTGEYDRFGDYNAGFKWRVYSK
jgi:translocation and assembly module TamB